MKLRPLLLTCLIVPLAGCVSTGGSDFLVTPVAIVGIHSFAPEPIRAKESDSTNPEPTLTAANGR